MIGYKDKTFCMSDCTNSGCHRYPHEEVIALAEQYGLPIAWANFSAGCEEYKPPHGDDDGNLPSEVG